MRKFLLAAVAVAAISSPALARDGSPYVGFEAGVAMSDEGFFDVDLNGVEFHSGLNTNYKLGIDADAIAGMDFGMFRLEGELGYKRLGIKDADASGPLLNAINAIVIPDITNDDLDFNDRVTVLSLMANALADFGGDTGLGAYIGGGFGRARVKMLGDQDSSWAWQGIAGIRAPIASQIDVGLKYRYFNSGKLRFADDFDEGRPVRPRRRGAVQVAQPAGEPDLQFRRAAGAAATACGRGAAAARRRRRLRPARTGR